MIKKMTEQQVINLPISQIESKLGNRVGVSQFLINFNPKLYTNNEKLYLFYIIGGRLIPLEHQIEMIENGYILTCNRRRFSSFEKVTFESIDEQSSLMNYSIEIKSKWSILISEHKIKKLLTTYKQLLMTDDSNQAQIEHTISSKQIASIQAKFRKKYLTIYITVRIIWILLLLVLDFESKWLFISLVFIITIIRMTWQVKRFDTKSRITLEQLKSKQSPFNH